MSWLTRKPATSAETAMDGQGVRPKTPRPPPHDGKAHRKSQHEKIVSTSQDPRTRSIPTTGATCE